MSNIAFTAPHYKASRAGLAILERGGSAIDAMIAAAATVAVEYPHMNSLGGDGFWLIQRKGEVPIAIDACGPSARAVHLNDYVSDHVATTSKTLNMPERGAGACITMAGTVAGWQLARQFVPFEDALPLSDLFSQAIESAENGIRVTKSLEHALRKCEPQFREFNVFNSIFTSDGVGLVQGDTLKNPRLASLFRDLSEQGLDSFYRGEIAAKLAADLVASGSPLNLEDFKAYEAQIVAPLSVDISKGKIFNLGAPTQGIASLLTLAIYDRLHEDHLSTTQFVHLLVEATKQAFTVRDHHVADPGYVSDTWPKLLESTHIDALSDQVDDQHAKPWPNKSEAGDTVWMGALDKDATMVSFIQSLYWEFGSGVVLPSYGLVWNNRGTSFSLDAHDINALAPNKKPRHTLNPALAVLSNGDRLVYGTMGGEGQPQTQAAIFARHCYHELSLNDAINSPRWLLGRTWGDQSTNLKIESTLFDEVSSGLTDMGHDLERVDDCSELMGHAGAIKLGANGDAQAATDKRSDGEARVKTLADIDRVV